MTLQLSSRFRQELQGFALAGSQKLQPADTPLKKISLIAWNALVDKMNSHINFERLSNWNRSDAEVIAEMEKAANEVRNEMQELLAIINKVL